MDKVAAYRSIARRAFLTKAAAASTASVTDALGRAIVNKLPDEGRGALMYHGLMDPGTLIPVLGIAGGAHQLTNVLDPDPEKSNTSRLVNGIAGLGLMAGGAYTFANDDARNAVRRAVYRLFGKAFKAK